MLKEAQKSHKDQVVYKYWGEEVIKPGFPELKKDTLEINVKTLDSNQL